jgi:hypothetical protein
MLKEKKTENVIMDLGGIEIVIMGKTSQFGWLVCCSLDNSTTKPIGKVLPHSRVHKGWTH